MKIIACMATTLDGKIAPAHSPTYTRISSDEDIRRLKSLRDTVDTVIMGAATFRAYPKPVRGLSGKPVAMHGILTRGASITEDIPPDAPAFCGDSAITIFSAREVPQAERASYPDTVQWIHAMHPVTAIRHYYEALSVQTLLVEGGGHVLGLFLTDNAIEELFLTLVPSLMGNNNAPSLVSGVEKAWQDVPKGAILSLEQGDNELYLHLKLAPSPRA